MQVIFEIPNVLALALAETGDLASQLKEMALVELYRLGRVSHGQLAASFSMSRCEVDEVLSRHKVTEDLITLEELEVQLSELRKRLA